MTRFPAIALAALLVILSSGGMARGAAIQDVTLTMTEFAFNPERIVLEAGTPTVITLVNAGQIAHEFMVYQVPRGRGHLHAWAEDRSYFRGMTVKVAGRGVTFHRKGRDIVEVTVEPGRTATVQFTPTRTGTFEIGCHIAGHYEAGMKGVFVVE